MPRTEAALDRQRLQKREWYSRNRVAELLRQAEYRAANPDKKRARAKKYADENPEKIVEFRTRYQTKIIRERPWLRLFRSVEKRARASGIAFDLDHTWMLRNWTGVCALTGIPFKIEIGRMGPRPFSPSIDRINPSLGYEQDNCRIILFAVNAMKSDATDSDVLTIAKALVAALEK